jgi:hypothetical protein
MKPFLGILLSFLILTPTFPVLAQTPKSQLAQGFVQCEGKTCSACDLIALANTMINWLITISFLFFAILAVRAGFKLITSQGNSGALSDAKQSFTNAFVGLVIILLAFLAVDTLMRKLIAKDGEITGYGPWSEVRCAEQVTPGLVNGYFEGDAEFISGTAAAAGTGGGGVTPTGNLVSYQGRLVDSAILDKVKYLDENFDLRFSGGHRTPQRNAEVGGSATSYHLSGRAADFVGSAVEMRRGYDWARANGAREVLIHNAGSGTHLHVAW